MRPEERSGLLYVALAVALFSTSPVLIAWADPVNPVAKTSGRMLVASIVMLITARLFSRGDTAQPTPRSTPRFLGYGLIAAFHFLCYIASLSYTTAAHSLSIIYTAPIFVTILSAFILHEPVRKRQWAGVGITVLGVAIIAGLEPRMTWQMAFGDALALLSAITFAIYSVAGHYERERYPLLTYASLVYGAAALWMLVPGLVSLSSTSGAEWGWRQILAIVALGVGPLAIGHTLYNASLRRVHATYVNIIASQEVTGGILLSYLLLSQVPSANSLVGAVLTLIGIGLVLR